MRRSRGSASPVVITLFVVGASAVAIGIAPETMRTVIPAEAIVVEEHVAPNDAELVAGTLASQDEAAHVAALLSAVRSGHPLLCELAAQGSSWGGNWRGEGPATPLQSRDPQLVELVRFAASAPRSREVIAPLRAALGDADPCVRRFAAPLLGRTKHAEAVETLVAALRDDSPLTREAAAVGLRFAEQASTVEPLLRTLEDREAAVRAAAAWALGEIEDARAISGLERALKDAESVVRINAAWALGEIEDAAAIPALTAALREDRDPAVRRMAAWALGHIE
jgi:hypothetical protein